MQFRQHHLNQLHLCVGERWAKRVDLALAFDDVDEGGAGGEGGGGVGGLVQFGEGFQCFALTLGGGVDQGGEGLGGVLQVVGGGLLSEGLKGGWLSLGVFDEFEDMAVFIIQCAGRVLLGAQAEASLQGVAEGLPAVAVHGVQQGAKLCLGIGVVRGGQGELNQFKVGGGDLLLQGGHGVGLCLRCAHVRRRIKKAPLGRLVVIDPARFGEPSRIKLAGSIVVIGVLLEALQTQRAPCVIAQGSNDA